MGYLYTITSVFNTVEVLSVEQEPETRYTRSSWILEWPISYLLSPFATLFEIGLQRMIHNNDWVFS